MDVLPISDQDVAIENHEALTKIVENAGDSRGRIFEPDGQDYHNTICMHNYNICIEVERRI